jgi:hypothetical protein
MNLTQLEAKANEWSSEAEAFRRRGQQALADMAASYAQELAASGEARSPDPCGEATSSESATMAESGSLSEALGDSVRRDGGVWKNGFGEGDSRSSSSSVRHLQGKAASLEEDGAEVEGESTV